MVLYVVGWGGGGLLVYVRGEVGGTVDFCSWLFMLAIPYSTNKVQLKIFATKTA
jgi:hypothetical protein